MGPISKPSKLESIASAAVRCADKVRSIAECECWLRQESSFCLETSRTLPLLGGGAGGREPPDRLHQHRADRAAGGQVPPPDAHPHAGRAHPRQRQHQVEAGGEVSGQVVIFIIPCFHSSPALSFRQVQRPAAAVVSGSDADALRPKVNHFLLVSPSHCSSPHLPAPLLPVERSQQRAPQQHHARRGEREGGDKGP